MRYSMKTQNGLSLIEVLVTTVVLGLGILGTSALQLTGIKGTDSAHYRTVATMIANDMADRIRANSAGVELGDYATDADNPISCPGQPSGFLDCNSSACTAAQLALFDKYQLTCGFIKTNANDVVVAKSGGVSNSIPNGELSISCGTAVCTSGVDHIITVSWIERADEEGQDNSSNLVLTITP